MAYQLRIILDTKEDIFKDIVVDGNKNLLDLHNFIKESFGLEGNELASYYTATSDWEQNEEEIPLLSFSEEEEATMSDFSIKQILPTKEDKLIYVYDLFVLWTFFIEVVKITTEEVSGMQVAFSFGEMPKEAPEKQMASTDNKQKPTYEGDEDDIFDEDDEDYDMDELDGLSEFDSDDYR